MHDKHILTSAPHGLRGKANAKKKRRFLWHLESKSAQRPFGMKDKLGYMFGDFGNDFTFILSSLFLMKFYTDVMGVSAGVVGIVMMAARIVDAFTDITMGQIVDRCKPTKDGKFRPWLKRMCGPVAIASFLIFQSGLAGMPYGFKVAWLAVTYILWGSIFYTSINIPYGSMASAVSPESKDRAELSTWRTIGGSLASLVIGVGTPMIAYVTVDGKTMLSGSRMTIIAGVFSVCAILCYLLCFKMVQERVQLTTKSEKLDLGKLVKSIATNRSLMGIIAAALMLLLSQLTMSGMSSYVYPNYYGSAAAQSLASLVGMAGTLLICAPTAVKLSQKFGKKELATAGAIVGAVAYLLCFLLRPSNPFVYVAFAAVATVSMGYFNTVVWAMITDVIDDTEVRTGVREDGTVYSVYSFARKLGQAISSGLIGALLTMIGYSEATAFDPAVTGKIFNLSCLAPFAGFVALALILVFLYPLSKTRVEQNVATLAARREGKEN
jgi:GPH family glycoside/pentoside/hexuronide:cation symporter